MTRSLTLEWEDPLATAERGLRMTGLAYLQALAAGELPRAPIAMLMGVDGLEVEPGKVTFTARPGEQHYNPIGMVHGGFAATLLDSAMGCAVQSLLGAGIAYSTLEIKVSYVRPLTAASGRVLASGQVVHGGRTIATAEGRVTDGSGRLYAHATTTCMVMLGASVPREVH